MQPAPNPQLADVAEHVFTETPVRPQPGVPAHTMIVVQHRLAYLDLPFWQMVRLAVKVTLAFSLASVLVGLIVVVGALVFGAFGGLGLAGLGAITK